MNYFTDALLALPRGSLVVLTNSRVRRKAVVPALMGLFVSVMLIGASVAFFGTLVELFGLEVSTRGAFLGSLSQFFLGFGLAVMIPILGLLLVVIFSAYYQVDIARDTLRADGVTVREIELPFFQEVLRSSLYETRKFLFLLPLLVLSFVMHLVPPLLPFAILLGGWILGREFVDIALEAKGVPRDERSPLLRSARFSTAVFGLTLGVLAAIPFGLILLSPFASAAAAKYVRGFDGVR